MTVLPDSQLAAMDAWICPRCGVVNAWWVARCRCKPPASRVLTGTPKEAHDA